MFSRVKYSGTTPGADVNTYNLYNSVNDGGAAGFAMKGIHIVMLDIKNAAAGTLKAYKGSARDTIGAVTYSQIEQFSVPIPASTESNKYEFLVEPYSDWKLDWVNGGAAQSTWLVDLALSDRVLPWTALPEPSTFQSVGAATTANVKATSGSLLSIAATNRNAGIRYLQLFNSTSSTATVLYQWPIAASAASTLILGTDFFTQMGWTFSTGITWGVSTTAGSYVAATAGETDVSGTYR